MIAGTVAGRARTIVASTWGSIAALTLGLGAMVAIAWFTVGGSAAYRGPEPVIRELWLPLYGFECVLAAIGTFALVRLFGIHRTGRIVGLVGAAWVGEFLVLFAGTWLAFRVGPEFAGFYWLIGTGGPAQPIAAALGGILATRVRGGEAVMTAGAAVTRARTLVDITWGSLAGLTLVFGLIVGVSWTIVGGRIAWQGGLESVIRDAWLPLYGLQAAFAAGVVFAFVQRTRVRSVVRLLGLVVGAWLGQLVVLTVAGGLLANEIDPTNAWFFWFVATGGPVQPIAAILGGLVALRLDRRPGG